MGLLALLWDNLERKVFHVVCNGRVVHLSADQALRIEDGVIGVHGSLVLGSISDEALGICERNPGRSGAVTLIVGDDLNLAVLVDAHTGVRGAEIDTDGGVNLLLLTCFL
mmetsp:Transcript_61850/g.127900  ORF Transcript_61850/g.127900 Transcript_61850/m.127900 type:complete len:110 (+) Transcript_61850:691-1020(+)